MPFTKILFPVDFSERSRIVAPHVRAVCERFNASLTLLHLVEVSSMAFIAPESSIPFEFPAEDLIAYGQTRLADFAAESFPDLPVKTVADQGDPGACIAELARQWNIDLIMLPTRGCGRFRAALLGSVTAKTLHDASCPVWTEAHAEEHRTSGSINADWRSVMCAIDTNDEGLRLIRFARDFAADTGAVVRLAHAVTTADSGSGKYFELEFAAFAKDRAWQTISDMQVKAGTNFGVCMETGPVAGTIRHAALAHRADLVLTGRGALPHFAGRLRSHAYAIVRDMPCPVLSI